MNVLISTCTVSYIDATPFLFEIILQEFSDARDADDARYNLDGRDFDGSRMIVEFAKGVILIFLTCHKYLLVYLLFSLSDYVLHFDVRFRVAREGLGTVTVVVTVNIWVGDLLLVLAVALTVGLTGTGLVTAKLATGKIGATAVEMVVT